MVLFAPLGQVILMHDFSSAQLSPVGHPALGLPSPLWLLASVWPLAALMILCGLVVTLRHFSAFLRWLDAELTHIGQNLLYYLVVINIFLASLQRSDLHRASCSLCHCLLGAFSILAASRFIHFMAGQSRKAAKV